MVQFDLLPPPPPGIPWTSPALRARGGELFEAVLFRRKAVGANKKYLLFAKYVSFLAQFLHDTMAAGIKTSYF